MTETATAYGFRTWPKDLGVLLIVAVALGLGLLLATQTTSRTRPYADSNSPLRLRYPAGWVETGSLQDVLLKVQDPLADSPFKTTLTVESRELDPQNPPTLQALLDRRVELRQSLTGYHFLANRETTVGGAKAMELEYAYVVQPIDEPRRAVLPVVVRAREVIVPAKDRAYYIALAAAANEFARASARLDQILATAQVQ